MARPILLITGSVSGAGTPGLSFVGVVGETLTITDSANPDGTYLFELVEKAVNQASPLVGPGTAAPTLLLDANIEGETFRIKCTRNLVEINELLFCTLTVGDFAGHRFPTYKERSQETATAQEAVWNLAGNVKGWNPDVVAFYKKLAETAGPSSSTANPLILDTAANEGDATGANSGLIVADSQGDAGTEAVELAAAGIAVGFVDAEVGSLARVRNAALGGLATGKVEARALGTSEVIAQDNGSWAGGWIDTGPTSYGTGRIEAFKGSLAFGSVNPFHDLASIEALGGAGDYGGCLAFGHVEGSATPGEDAIIRALGRGSVALGNANSYNGPARVIAGASNLPAFAFGATQGGEVSATNFGAVAMGDAALNGLGFGVRATGVGARAGGTSRNAGNDILASGQGASAFGSARGGNIVAAGIGGRAGGSTSGAGASLISNLSRGSWLWGDAYAGGTGIAEILSTDAANFGGNFVFGGAYGGSAPGFGRVQSTGVANFVFGYAAGLGTNQALIEATNLGSIVMGRAGAQTNDATLRSSGYSSFASGHVYASGGGSPASQILASGHGSRAHGYVKGGAINALDVGTRASGMAIGPGDATVEANESGSFVHGRSLAQAVGAIARVGGLTDAPGSFVYGLTIFGQANAIGATSTAFVRDRGPTFASYGGFISGYSRSSSSGKADVYSNYSPVAVFGHANTYGAGDATVRAQNRGSVAMGLAITSNAGDAIVRASGFGCFAWGYVTALSTGNAEIRASGSGAMALGYVRPNTAAPANILAAGRAAFAHGATVDGDISASGRGAWATGESRAGADIIASGDGARAHGNANGGDILAVGAGSLATGVTLGAGTSELAAREEGDLVHGFVDAAVGGVATLETSTYGYNRGNVTLGSARTYGAGIARVGSGDYCMGSLVVGTATTFGAATGTAEVRANLSAHALGWASIDSTQAYNATVRANGRGSLVVGGMRNTNTATADGIISAEQYGSFALGYMQNQGPGSQVRATTYAAVAIGSGGSQSGGSLTTCNATGRGAFAHAYVRNGTVLASGRGARATGYTIRGSIQATGDGSLAMGRATVAAAATGYFLASGDGAHATGQVNATGVLTAGIIASGDGSRAHGHAVDGIIQAIPGAQAGSFAGGFAEGPGTALISAPDTTFVHGHAQAEVAGAYAFIGAYAGSNSAQQYAGAVFGFAKATLATSSAIVRSGDNTGSKCGLVAGQARSAGTGAALLESRAYSSIVAGHAETLGPGTATMFAFGRGSGVFGSAYLRAGNPTSALVSAERSGAFCFGYVYATAGGGALAGSVRATGYSSFAQGGAQSQAIAASLLASGQGSFAGGYLYAGGDITASGQGSFARGWLNNGHEILATGRGSLANGTARGPATGSSSIQASDHGATAMGYALCVGTYSADIVASADGAIAMGFANGATANADITASGQGAGAFGRAVDTTIAATADNAFQFGPGTNAIPDSLQVGGGFQARADGRFGGANAPVILGVGVATFPTVSNMMTLTGDGALNAITTISAGFSGQVMVLFFVDGNITMVDDGSSTADTINLSAAFVSAANASLTLGFDGTSWKETARSFN